MPIDTQLLCAFKPRDPAYVSTTTDQAHVIANDGQTWISVKDQIMDKTRLTLLPVLLALSLSLPACKTATGAAVGAGAGAAVGAGTGYGAGKGALIGTGIGAAAGAIYDIVEDD